LLLDALDVFLLLDVWLLDVLLDVLDVFPLDELDELDVFPLDVLFDVLDGADVLDTLLEDEDCFLLADLSCR
jgi:hypothetical protein